MVIDVKLIALAPLEVWGKVECTVNYVGEEYFDQLERNSHARRLDDNARKYAERTLRELLRNKIPRVLLLELLCVER